MMKRVALGGLIIMSSAVIWMVHDLVDRTVESRFEGTIAEPVRFRIDPNETFQSVLKRLSESNLIGLQITAKLWAKWAGIDKEIKHGHFQIPPKLTTPDLLRFLTMPPAEPSWRLTIPEGFNRWQIADVLQSHGYDREAVLHLIESNALEGKLFPSVYFISKRDTVSTILQRMHHQFEKEFNSLKAKFGRQSSLPDDDIVTLASMVEKETIVAEEAPMIARVFYNRLQKKMKLQSDPTYVYTADRYGQKPTKADRLNKKNPYNTDNFVGLPPGPIANPGRNALIATFQPSDDPKSMKWLFFVAKRDGSSRHFFSKTYRDHKKAIRRYLRGKD